MTRDELDACIARKVSEHYTWRRVLRMSFWPIIAPTLLIVGMLGVGPLAQDIDQGRFKATDTPTFTSLVNGPMSVSIGSLVTIHLNGQITYGPDYTPDAAAAAFWRAIEQAKPRTVTLTFSEDEWAAATKRVGMCASVPVPPAPGADVNVVQFDCAETIRAWAHKRLVDDLSQELTAIRLQKAAALEEADASLKALDASDCAAVNAALKARKKPALKQCGGGGMP